MRRLTPFSIVCACGTTRRNKAGVNRGYPEVGRYFKVTRERLQQIEAKALKKLCHPSRACKLRE